MEKFFLKSDRHNYGNILYKKTVIYINKTYKSKKIVNQKVNIHHQLFGKFGQ